MDLSTMTIFEASTLLAQRRLSPVELTRFFLERIERLDPILNAFITVTAESALAAARSAEDEMMHGRYRGPLHGIPLALKDLFETRGVLTTAGAAFRRRHVPDADATVVRRLKAGGAILLGKLNMHEWALGVTNENPHFGPCHNPWRTGHISGGSSGGSAAALAAGLCLGSMGTDTGGSIRIPASLCGVVGLKPTRGRVSLTGVVPLSWNLDHAGPMARRVRDVALLLDLTAGYDALDPASVNMVVEKYGTHLEGGVHGRRIALAGGDNLAECDPEVREAVRQAANVFRDSGAEVEELSLPELETAARVNGMMVVSDAAGVHRERLASEPGTFGDDVRRRLEMGAELPTTEYVQLRRTQAEMIRHFELLFAEFDLIVSPATAITAPAIGDADALEQARRLTRFTGPFNLTGLPAVSLPCGFSGNDLPIGLQIVGPAWSEARVLQAAAAYEAASGWYRRQAPLAG